MIARHWLLLLTISLLLGRAETSLPDPPRQKDAWQAIPTAEVPEELVEAVAMLFEAGMSDPRGGEYREIELDRIEVRGRGNSGRGWYFEGGFAVGWDGMVHRVKRVGEKQDLRNDVVATLSRETRDSNPVVTVPHGVVSVAMLLRLGESDLARQMYLDAKRRFMAGLPIEFRGVDGHFRRRESFRSVAGAWLRVILQQAVLGFAEGDNRTAMEIAEWLTRVRGAVDLAWKKAYPEMNGQSPTDFLATVPRIRADSARRLRQPDRPPFDERVTGGLPISARIAALIERLEDVKERQRGIPGESL